MNEEPPSADANGAISPEAEALVPAVVSNLLGVRRRIEDAGGDPRRVEVVAVTKGFGREAVLAATRAGLRAVGENYAEELREKSDGLGTDQPAEWHFIGRIQRNKVGRIAGVVSCWQTIARVAEARTISRHTRGPSSAFVEINLSGDPQRAGCSPAEAEEVVDAVQQAGLTCRGLMAIGPLGLSPDGLEDAFGSLAQLSRRLGLLELSIGMSDDLEAAVRAGSTMVRVGRALFGPRNGRADR